jgi:hypothetical protein
MFVHMLEAVAASPRGTPQRRRALRPLPLRWLAASLLLALPATARLAPAERFGYYGLGPAQT